MIQTLPRLTPLDARLRGLSIAVLNRALGYVSRVWLRDERGFNILDLLVYIGMVGVIAGGVLPSLIHARASAISSRAESDLQNLNTAINMVYTDLGYYPGAQTGSVSAYALTSANMTINGVNYLSATPLDPVTHTNYTLTVTTTNGVVAYTINAPGTYDSTTLTSINGGAATTDTSIEFTSDSGLQPT